MRKPQIKKAAKTRAKQKPATIDHAAIDAKRAKAYGEMENSVCDLARAADVAMKLFDDDALFLFAVGQLDSWCSGSRIGITPKNSQATTKPPSTTTPPASLRAIADLNPQRRPFRLRRSTLAGLFATRVPVLFCYCQNLRGHCRLTWATATSSTQCATPSWRRIGKELLALIKGRGSTWKLPSLFWALLLFCCLRLSYESWEPTSATKFSLLSSCSTLY
jgi:hypothetical protein